MHRRQPCRLGRLVRQDALAQPVGVVRREQHVQRHLHEVGVAQVFVVVAEGAAHRLHEVMDAVGFIHALEIDRRKDVQHFGECHAAGRRRWRRDDLVAGVGQLDRLALLRPIAGQVGQRPGTAGGTHRPHQLLRHRTLVETVRTLFGQRLQRSRLARIAEDAGLLGHHAARHELAGRGRITAQHVRLVADRADQRTAGMEALLGQPDRRTQRHRERQLAVLARHVGDAGRKAGDAGSQRPVERGVAIGRAVRFQVVLLADCLRRHLARVDEGVLAGGRIVDHGEETATHARSLRLHHRQRRTHRDRGVHGVAAAREDLETGLGSQRVGAGYRRGLVRRRVLRVDQHAEAADRERQQDAMPARPAVRRRAAGGHGIAVRRVSFDHWVTLHDGVRA